MAGFTKIKDMVDAEEAGQVRRYSFHKTPSQATTAGLWFDLAMSPGYPVPKYWFDAPPLIAKAVSYTNDLGIYCGAAVSPQKKFLRMAVTQNATATGLPMRMILCDYLLYYPSIDDSTTDVQTLDNSVTLPRYTDGKGVQVMAVSVASRVGGQSFSFSYTNSDGVAGRTSQTVTQNAGLSIGTIATTNTATLNSCAPFIGLQAGDSGVRSIQSVTMNGADVGLFALLLVKPLASTMIYGIDAPVEKDFLIDSAGMPEIKDDAYLNWICLPNGALNASAIIGDIKIIYN